MHLLQVDEELDELISRIKLEEGNTEFWKRRFLGEGLNVNQAKPVDEGEPEPADDELDEGDVAEDASKDIEDDDGEEEEEVEQTESQEVEVEVDRIKDKEVEAKKPLQMIGVQLLKDSDQTTTRSKKSRRRSSRVSVEVRR